MARYVDAFVLPISKKKVEAYRRIAALAGKIWKEHGALAYIEAVGDDLQHKGVVPFPRLAKAKRGETVIVAWIVFKSRAHRDKVNTRVMKDPRMHLDPKTMPVDMRRMAYGGFSAIVDVE